jgi:hypothetical protein
LATTSRNSRISYTVGGSHRFLWQPALALCAIAASAAVSLKLPNGTWKRGLRAVTKRILFLHFFFIPASLAFT